jgi:hypothetical protein
MHAGGRRLSYSPSVEEDALLKTSQGDLIPINQTLAFSTLRGSRELYFHGNSVVTPWEGGTDVHSQYRILRWRRQWTGILPGLAPGPLAVGYTLETQGPYGFVDDSGHQDKSWYDCPGERLTGATTKSYRALQEFVTGVGSRHGSPVPIADFGGLYYVVAIDITPTQYRVWMSLERRLSGDQIAGAMGVPAKVYPSDVLTPGPPDFASWRFVPHGFTSYAQWLR